MRANAVKLFFIAIITLVLTGCGFHLNTQAALPKDYLVLYVKSDQPYSYFTKTLTSTLKNQGATLVSDASKAPITLNIMAENLKYTQTSVGSTQQTRQYLIVYSIRLRVESSKGKVIAGPFDITQSMNQTMFANQLIENTQQLNEDERQLSQRIIIQLFYHLSARDTLKAIRQHRK